MTFGNVSFDLPAMFKEMRQTGFPVVLVMCLGFALHHWGTRAFDEIWVPESKAKIVLMQSVAATNEANARSLSEIVTDLKRFREQYEADRRKAG
jgi:hypothetical protein